MQQSGGSLNVSSSWNSLHYTYSCPSQPLKKKVTKRTPGLAKSIQSTSRKKKEKNMKIATDSLFLEHGHYLHQHTGLKSVTEQSCCAVTQDLSVGTRTERENLSKIAFTERSNRTAKKPGGLQMGTTILCLACKISSGNMKGKGRRGVWVCKDTHRAFLREPEGSEPSLLCPDWDWTQHPGHPGGAACWDHRRVQSQEGNTGRGWTLKKLQQICLISQPEHLWVLLREGCMANNKLSHIPFSTGLVTVTGKEKKISVHRGNMNPREVCDN